MAGFVRKGRSVTAALPHNRHFAKHGHAGGFYKAAVCVRLDALVPRLPQRPGEVGIRLRVGRQSLGVVSLHKPDDGRPIPLIYGLRQLVKMPRPPRGGCVGKESQPTLDQVARLGLDQKLRFLRR